MSELKPLVYERHKLFKIDIQAVHQHIADQRMMPVVLSEFQNCAMHFPIVVSKNADTGAFVCVVVFGFEQGENLFWKEAAWDALYTPLNVQRQPFFIAPRSGEDESTNADDYVLYIDESSPCVSKDDNGEALFNGDGSASAYLQKTQSNLKDLLSGEAATTKFIQSLNDIDLLMPLALDITFKNKQTQRVDGAYTINEEKLYKLADADILKLQKSGYLASIYTMLVSLGQLYLLIDRKNRMLEGADSWFKKAKA